jgi:hypothetical protein
MAAPSASVHCVSTAVVRRTSLGLLLALLATMAVLGLGAIRDGAAAQARLAVNQCNGVDNTPGLATECHVTVVNNLNTATGATSSTLSVRECHGAARARLTCTQSVTPSTQLVSSVTQCNDSANGGGGTVECTVRVTNNITGEAETEPATVNQCVGSGGGGGANPLMCDPYPASTTNATITQCNGSANEGGGTGRVECTVLPSAQTDVLPVRINQCNGSANLGGSTVDCTAQLLQRVVAAQAPTGTASVTATVTASTTPTATVTSDATPPAVTDNPTTDGPGAPPAQAPPATELPRTGPASQSLATPAALSVLIGSLLLLLVRGAPRRVGAHRRTPHHRR